MTILIVKISGLFNYFLHHLMIIKLKNVNLVTSFENLIQY